MIAPPTTVASPGRRRDRARALEQHGRTRAQTVPVNYASGGLSFGDAVEQSPSPQPPAGREPIPQNDFLDFLSGPAAPSQPFSAPNPDPAGLGPPTHPQEARAATTDDMFDFFGDFKTNAAPPVAAAAPTQPSFESTTSEGSRKKKKKKNRTTRTRAATDTIPRSPPTYSPPLPPIDAASVAETAAPPKTKMKQIDVLPLLHQGIRLNKFKFAGHGRPKPRTFSLSQDNKFLRWEAKGAESLAKSAEDRQVYLGQIRQIRRNDPNDLTALSDIRHKQFTITIVYVHRGGEKTLNIMAFNAFHYQMVSEGLEHLVEATQNTGRDLADIFELYLDFAKDILPDHLKPTRFKWEALKDDEIATRERTQTVPIQSDQVDVWIPTETRDRVSSF